MSERTFTRRASSGLSMTLGTITAARMPRMTTTTSIRVKPDCLLRVCMAVLTGKILGEARPARIPIIHQGPHVPHGFRSRERRGPAVAATLVAPDPARAMPVAGGGRRTHAHIAAL